MSTNLAEFKQIGLVNTLRSCQLFTGLPLPDLENIAVVTVSKALAKGTSCPASTTSLIFPSMTCG